MHRDFLIAAKALASLAVLTSGAAIATPSGSPAAYPTSQIGVLQLEAAANLADLGRATRDPLLLVAAARVVIASGVTPGPPPEPEPERKVSAKSTVAVTTATTILEISVLTPMDGLSADRLWSAESLLAEAATMAGADQVLLAIIRETEAGNGRGVVIGPLQTNQIIMPGKVQRFRVTFAARERADAALRVRPEPPGGKLTLTVLDEKKRRVATAVGNAVNGTAQKNSPLYIQWQPERCAAFVLVVENTGTVPAAYTLNSAPSEASAALCLKEQQSSSDARRSKGTQK